MPSAAETIQKVVPNVILWPSRDRELDLGISSNNDNRIVHHKVCSIRSTKS